MRACLVHPGLPISREAIESRGRTIDTLLCRALSITTAGRAVAFHLINAPTSDMRRMPRFHVINWTDSVLSVLNLFWTVVSFSRPVLRVWMSCSVHKRHHHKENGFTLTAPDDGIIYVNHGVFCTLTSFGYFRIYASETRAISFLWELYDYFLYSRAVSSIR